MAKKTNLRDFQEYLAGRLSEAAQGRDSASWLAFEVGDEGWLVELPDGGEIVQAAQLVGVPLTRPWFAGLANIRGNLHAVTDFSLFCGASPTPRTSSARLLLVGVRHGSNAALLVPRLLGLRSPGSFQPAPPDAARAAWCAQAYIDPQGRPWRKLDVRELLLDREFMNIGV